MDKNIKRLCSICVRGGSKGIPSKNIRQLMGKPLFAYSIEQAKQSGLFSHVVLSSDSAEILSIAQQYNLDLIVKRPKNLAQDNSPKLPAIQHCLKISENKLNTKFDTVIDLDATSPLRNIEDIIGVVEMLEKNPSGINVITGTPSRKSPYFNLVEVDKHGFVFLSGMKKKWKEMIIYTNDNIENALMVLNEVSQIVFVLDKNGQLKGTITDRDIKKGFLKGYDLKTNVSFIMNTNPTTISENTDEEEVFKVFEKTKFLHLPVVDNKCKLLNVRFLETTVRRQDTPISFDLNASIYAWWRNNLINSKNVITEKTKIYVMPEDRSVDIDTELDFKWVEFLMSIK